MPEVTLVQAINLALAHEMARDESVVVLGEDVGVSGGVFRATEGLLDRFGPERVLDTPLAETVIAGMAVGLSVLGFRAVAEIQFAGFIYPAIDQMQNHAARMRSRTRGRLSCPLVLRAPSGGGIRPPEHHSDSPEAMFAHIPGLRVVVPSSPSRAYGLLLAAIRDPDPVVFLEPTRLYRASREEVADDGEALPLDTCFTLRAGTDLTLVTWGGTTPTVLAAADALEQEGVSVAVIDVATLSPPDMGTILASVEATGRCVIVHEAPLRCGVGAEIAARLADEGLPSLVAPVARATGFDVPFPLPRLEGAYMPGPARVLAAARRVLEYA